MKKEIWENKELLFTIGTLIGVILLELLFAYIGYMFCIDNEYDPIRGVIFGALFPVAFIGMKALYKKIKGNEPRWLTSVLIFILLIFISMYLPIWIGIIILALLIYLAVKGFQIEYQEAKKKKTTVSQYHQVEYHPPKVENMWKDTAIESLKEEIYCERCFKEISEEEYEENDGMCEDCFEDVLLGDKKWKKNF